MAHHLISFLGINLNYTPTIYRYRGVVAQESAVMSAVLAELLQPDVVHIAMTEAAEKANWHKVQAAFAERFPTMALHPVSIPNGETEEELWQIFNTIADAIPEGEGVTLDVTHGFRHQPMLALAAARYMQVAKKAVIMQVVYGAFEIAKDAADHIAPIFDMTQFMDLITLSGAVETFQQYGDARPLADLQHNEALSKPVRAQLEQLKKMTLALSTIRLKESFAISSELRPLPIEDNSPQEKPFRTIVNQAIEQYRALIAAAEQPFSAMGFTAQAAMIQHYLDTLQYQQAITLAREALISKEYIRQLGSDAGIWEYQNRLAVEKAFNTITPKEKEKSAASIVLMQPIDDTLLEAWKKLTGIRNDFSHASMKATATDANKMILNIKKRCEEVIAYLQTP